MTENIQKLTRELKLCDVPRDAHKELQRVLPSVEEEQIRTSRQPPAAGLMTQHQDVYEGELSPSEYGNAGAHPST